MKIIVVVFLSILSFSCIGGWSDVICHLGGGYFFYNEGTPMNSILRGKKNGSSLVIEKSIILPNVSLYDFDDNFIIVRQNPNRKIVNRSISGKLFSKFHHFQFLDRPDSLEVSVFRDDSFDGNDSLIVKRMIEMGYIGDNMEEDIRIGLLLADSITHADPEYTKLFLRKQNYYIISKNDDKVYGPYSNEEYRAKRKELNVSDALTLEKE